MISQESAQELLKLLRKASYAVAELHGRGIGCPDCEDGAVGSRMEPCAFERAIDAAIARAEGK